MVKSFAKISILFLLLGAAACQKSGGSGSSGGFSLLGDDTDKAVSIVGDANKDLDGIRKIFKDSQGKVADLQEAMGAKDGAKVKSIASDLVTQINDGMTLGNTAVDKLKKAGDLNIKPEFKKYLSMKEDALQKLLDAFDTRREAVVILRDKFGTSDPAELDKVKVEFKTKFDASQDLLADGQQQSTDANNYAKNILKKAQ